VTSKIQNRANELIAGNLSQIKRVAFSSGIKSEFVVEQDLAQPYIDELGSVINLPAIASAGLKLGTDPLGGSGLYYWDRIAEQYGLDITVVNNQVDQRFSFMHVDKDGQIRMDCSSEFAMQGLIKLKDSFDLAFGNDPDFDRHGIVTPSVGLMNPNHYLATAIDYLYQNRPQWDAQLKVGKTLVSSSIIDRVAHRLKRNVVEMPVGFKWFVSGLLEKEIGFAGEESAGGIFLKQDGAPWATDKDGFIMCLLAAEMTAVTGSDPGQLYQKLTEEFGTPSYKRIDVPASLAERQQLAKINAQVVDSDMLAGEKITGIETHASGNNASIGGIKVFTDNCWFAARPSGTEDVYKIYAESFQGEKHLETVIEQAQGMVAQAFK
jgi:phosphoglucomutase